jgi:hypothetical protein
MSRAGLVPVHDEPGGITFKYEVTNFNFASNIKHATTRNEDAGNAEDVQISNRKDESPRSLDNFEEVPDFLGFNGSMEPEVSA